MHLTKYRNVRLIDNTDPTSPLAHKISAEMGTLKNDGNGEKTFTPFGVPARPLAVGEKACLRVINSSKTPLNITIIDLSPDWSISQIYPDPDVKEYELLETGNDAALFFEMETWLPENYAEGTDTLKVFANVEGTSFRWLELDGLDKGERSVRSFDVPKDALEALMSNFSAPNMRNMKPVVNLSSPGGRNWTTAQVEVVVRRPSIAHVTDPALSLLQSAFDQVIAKSGAQKTRSINGREETFKRPELSNPIINEVTQYCVALAQNQVTGAELRAFNKDALSDAQQRGAFDTVKYCASMAAGVAHEWFNAKIWGDDKKYEEYKLALNKKFGGCDLQYQEAVKQFLEFLKNRGHVPYSYSGASERFCD